MSSVGIGTHADLNCVVMSFGADNGEVKSKAIVADGPRMSLGGKIDMNLGEETLDIILIPSQKKRIFSKATPVKIHGPMKNPKIEAIPAKAALREVAGFTLLSTGVFIPIAVVSKTWSVLSDGDKVGGGCENVKEMSEKAHKEVKKLE